MYLLRLKKEALTDGSKVYSVLIIDKISPTTGIIKFDCIDEKHATELYTILGNSLLAHTVNTIIQD